MQCSATVLKTNSPSLHCTAIPTPSQLPLAPNISQTINPPVRSSIPQYARPFNKRSAQACAPQPAAKRSATLEAQTIPTELGEYIDRDVTLLKRLGWTEFIRQRRGQGDFASLDNVHHPARRLLKLYKYRGAPVKFSTPPWSQHRINQAIIRGPHKSCDEHIDFLEEEFIDMIQKGQWIVLPASVARQFKHLRVLPPGVVPQRERRPHWIGDYTYSGVNLDTLPLAALEAMQFGHALERLMREILLANPAYGPILMAKFDVSDGFYRVNLNIDDIQKLGLAFPTRPGAEPLVAFPLVLPMGWKNSPPIFSTVTETIADLTNQQIRDGITLLITSSTT